MRILKGNGGYPSNELTSSEWAHNYTEQYQRDSASLQELSLQEAGDPKVHVAEEESEGTRGREGPHQRTMQSNQGQGG